MPVMIVTRLRLKDPALLDEFFTSAVALREQAKTSAGNLGSDAHADGSDVWWTVSAWQDRASMQAYIDTDPHRSAMPHVDDWCDEASFADWEQDSPELPDWQTGYEHIVAHGLSATLTNPSAANQTREFPPPVLST